MKRLQTLSDIDALGPPERDRFFSATHEEIKRGDTTDVYFVKTQELLQRMGKADEVVVAEIFPRRPGVLAGVQECLYLLADCQVEVWTLDEGERFEAHEVVMRIRGPYSRFGIYETALLGFLASSSGWATAASQAKEAAGDKPVISFGARHVHPAVAPVMERAAVIGGCDGAACILAARFLDLEPAGTVPHALFLIVGDTVQVAQAYDRWMPPQQPRTILVDTFKDEVEESLRLLESLGPRLQGVRLDTPSERGGVTPGLVRELRARLDQAGATHVKIFVSGGLNPEKIRQLSEAGADAFGVGSFISGTPPIDMTMDLKEVSGRPVAKRGRIPGLSPAPRLKKVLPAEN